MDVRLRGVRYGNFDGYVDPADSSLDSDSAVSSSNPSPRASTARSVWSRVIRWIRQPVPITKYKYVLLIIIITAAITVTVAIARTTSIPTPLPIPNPPFLPVIDHLPGRTLQQYNRTYTLPGKCRNTRQGREFITDDTGAICLRREVISTGCCENLVDRLSCSSCRPDVACCASYEYCVSCCLKHSHKSLLSLPIQFPPSQYDKCLSTCRTSSRSLKHGNKYKHKHKFCYTEGDHDIPLNHTMAKIMTAERGYSCSLSCQSQRLVCHDTYLPKINTCDILKRHFPCEKGCENGQGSDQPAYVVPDAPDGFPRGLCLVNTDVKLFDCESAHENTRRLCVCIPPEAVDQ